MKHGVHLPKDRRDDMARRAFVIASEAETYRAALLIVEVEFDVSTPTARNLISRGRFLALHAGDG